MILRFRPMFAIVLALMCAMVIGMWSGCATKARTQPANRTSATTTTQPAKTATPSPAGATSAGVNSAATPVPRTDQGWINRNRALNELARKDDIDLMFLGDSITEGWNGAGMEVWHEYFGQHKAANF